MSYLTSLSRLASLTNSRYANLNNPASLLALEGLRIEGEVCAHGGWDIFEEVGGVEGAFDQIAVGFASVVSELRAYITAFRRVDVKYLHSRAARVIKRLQVDPLDLWALQGAEVDPAALLGETEAAFKALEQALNDHTIDVTALQLSPVLARCGRTLATKFCCAALAARNS